MVPYARHLAPNLNGHPIEVGNRKGGDTAHVIAMRLSPVLMDLAQRVLEAEMDRPADMHTLRVTAASTPRLDSQIALDAVFLHLVHQYNYDLVVNVVEEDLAVGEKGVFGTVMLRSLSLYTVHRDLETEAEALAPLERTLPCSESLAHWEGVLSETGHASKPLQAESQPDEVQDIPVLEEDAQMVENVMSHFGRRKRALMNGMQSQARVSARPKQTGEFLEDISPADISAQPAKASSLAQAR